MSWAYFFAHTSAAFQRLALCLCGALRIMCGDAIKIYGGSPSTCFLPFVADKHGSFSRRGSAIRLFRTLSSTAPDGFGYKAKTTIIMQTTALSPRTAQLRPLTLSNASLQAWLNAKSKFFTHVCGFRCTRREVLRVNTVFASMGMGALAAETNILLSILCIAIAAYNVRRLNQEDNLKAQKGGRR